MTDNFDEIFPGKKNCIYLNTPAIGLLSKDVYRFRQSQIESLLNEGSRYFEQNGNLLAEVREKIAEIYHGDPSRIALNPAFTFGHNAIIESLKPKSKILLLESDYPSVNKAVEVRDFETSYAKIDAHLEENIHSAFIKHNPEVFVFSIVQYLNGIRIDLDFVKQLKEEFPDTLMIADGTQFMGMEQFDFKNSGIDILGASAYKWINAGFGNAFFMFKPGVEKKINPKFRGFGSTMGKYKEAGGTLIGKFEGSHLDNSNIGSIKVALELQQKIGFSKIERRVRGIAKAAKSAFEDLGILENAVAQRKRHSPIFNIRGGDSLFQKLEKNNILTSQRGSGIRVGFHYYNSLEDLDKLIEVLKSTKL